MKNRTSIHANTVKLTVTALLMAMNIIMSSFGIPVPGGHLYLNDVIVCLAALLLDPPLDFVVGGIGAFLGDFFFYPTPMFVSLVTHGLQALAVSMLFRRVLTHRPRLSAACAVAVGAVIMVAGYTLGRTFIYANWQTAVVKLPYQILQASVGAVLGPVLYFRCGIRKAFDSVMK